jgi:Rad3-related DNA helicase
MIIDLKQAVGRGVRTVTDKCVITFLDNRLATARYKQRIFNSFKYEITATRNIADIKTFLGR